MSADPRGGGKRALLADLPTFPRGVVSLSLPVVAACLRPRVECRLLDLNFHALADWRRVLEERRPFDLFGLKVSAQSLEFARAATALARAVEPGVQVVWGGELPTLLPDVCLESADAVVRGRIEPSASALASDLEAGRLRRRYEAAPDAVFETPVPALDLVETPEAYLSFMGLPLESSLGCTQHCTFCMVHEMQPRVSHHPAQRVALDLAANPREFVNVVDYNLGNDRARLLSLAAALERSSAAGWMGEMCLDALEDAEVLEALARSRCRAVYCGLESVSAKALRAVAKTQNRIDDYLRVVRGAQAAGVEVASGYIVGLEDSNPEAFADFCDEAGILYVKLTTLTFNPGTKVRSSMAALGTRLTEDPSRHDGVRLSFLPRGAQPSSLREGARGLIRRFYSPASLWKRSRHLAASPARRAEFVLFSWCYGRAYRHWLEADLLDPADRSLEDLLARPWRKSRALSACEAALAGLRRFSARA